MGHQNKTKQTKEGGGGGGGREGGGNTDQTQFASKQNEKIGLYL